MRKRRKWRTSIRWKCRKMTSRGRVSGRERGGRGGGERWGGRKGRRDDDGRGGIEKR